MYSETKDNEVASSDIAPTDISSWIHLADDDDDLLLVNDDLNLNTSSLRSDEKYIGFDNNVGDTWIYPSNFPERAYQYNIVQKALFHNTLVVLPTGLGKTFIAAVVMYNIYRWYPMGKVIFMAPTRPLVAQQIEACCKIMGIPRSDSVEITGKLNKANRAQLWQTKRVFFATPQSVQSDIMDTELNFPFHAVKLIVVDEAHRAKGRYAYTEVISFIWSKNKYFRVLALSATPGRRKDDVEEVIRNLFISSLEVRTEDSVDVISYVFKRDIKTVVVKLGQKLCKIRDELLAIADPHIRNLIDNRIIAGRPGSISRNWLVMENKRFRESLLNNRIPLQKELSSDFSISISVYNAIELLERHGLRVFLNNFDETQDGGTKFVVLLRPDLRRLIQKVREEVGPNPFAYSDECMVNGEIAAIPANIDFGHPKFEIVRDHVLAHFENNKEARVIIFCEYRESVMLMHRLLLQHRPLIRPRLFVGQGGTGSIRAVTQQQQIKVMNDFRSGVSNALIATSVAEEGIDVGEVDLIVCFDISTTNPTRFIQRIGRTGRKKAGKVLLLATEGKEHTILKEVLSERNKLNKSISRGGEFASVFYKQAPRMVPTEFNPKCMKTFIQPTTPQEKTKPSKSTLKNPRVPKIGQERDLRHFFKQNVVLNDEEQNIFEDSGANKSTASRSTIVDNSQAIMDFSIPKLSDISNKTMKKIAKYVRTGFKHETVEAVKAVASNRLSQESLNLLVDFSPNFLHHVWTHMCRLWKKGIDDNCMQLKGVTSEDRQAVRAYHQIMKILDSKEDIALVVKKTPELPSAFCFSSLIEKYRFIFGDAHRTCPCQDNFEFLVEKFKKLTKLFPSDECPKEISFQSLVYDDEVDEIDYTAASINESSSIVDSKYMSQWEKPRSCDIRSVCESQRPGNSLDKPSVKAYGSTNVAQIVQSLDKYKCINPIEETNENSDDDVVFVGVSQQSTPIRTGSLKQSLLNFNETPIVNTFPKNRLKQRLAMKEGQRNRLDFIKSNEPTSLYEDAQNPPKGTKQSKENDMDLFDDQFDAIIAANSCIIKSIESSAAINNANAINNMDFDDVRRRQILNETIPHQNLATSYHSVGDTPLQKTEPCSSNIAKTSPRPISNDSTPDDIVPLANITNVTPNRKSNLDVCDSTLRNTTHDIKTKQNLMKTDVLNMVHPELANIDFNHFSEAFSDEISENFVTQLSPAAHKTPQRISPDIFEELSEAVSESKAKEKSPLRLAISPPAEVSPCLLAKKALTWKEVRLKYGKASQSESRNPDSDDIDDSVIHVASKIRPKRKIINSDSDQDVVPDSQKFVRKRQVKKTPLGKRRTNEFIDDEAVLSGSATEDEFEQTQDCYMIDSVVVHDDDAEDDLVNMTEVYLQSVRSQTGNSRGAFKIPARRPYNDASKIFSQKVPDDNGSYMKDSFVISDEGSDEEQPSMCPLERAEKILKMRRRAKRKAKLIADHEFKQPAKKKRLLMLPDSNSEDEDDFA